MSSVIKDNAEFSFFSFNLTNTVLSMQLLHNFVRDDV